MLHGNVWEWCRDWYGPYALGEQTDPIQLKKQSEDNRRIVRGCSWKLSARHCRSAHRNAFLPGQRFDDFGFRVCFHLDSTTPRGVLDRDW
jgi:formylglycine-generating enzyme required for sulfatase activity